ncbi:hypothetical protein [Bdellovibrio svalbardensis]|uniref:Uncharacterized protein n=1 Tax=Bdellovibrio svalbardensis TaxID=2972972 RepID=A0ABT6DIA7_9BACT|nr:hypothetical protein [Bdellovibrio svalbardensis]MDG0815596.1 hypothetical protein [Bdellovibrio svalbardensis]
MKFTAQSVTGFLTVFLPALFLTTQVFANNNASVASSTTTVQDPRHGSIFSGFVQASRSTSLYDFQDGTRKDGMDYAARFNMKLTKDYTLRLDGGYSQDLVDPQGDDFGDTSLGLLRAPVALGKLIMMGYKVGVVAPTSKASRTLQNMQGAVSGSVSVSINPERLIQGLSIVSGLSLRRNFHQYDTAMNGAVNTQYSSSQSISVGYDWASGVSISGEFIHKNGLTYQNNIKESFEHTEELGYSINDAFAVAVGHTNSGNALKANGVDSNVALIDENSSLVYGSLTVAF